MEPTDNIAAALGNEWAQQYQNPAALDWAKNAQGVAALSGQNSPDILFAAGSQGQPVVNDNWLMDAFPTADPGAFNVSFGGGHEGAGFWDFYNARLAELSGPQYPRLNDQMHSPVGQVASFGKWQADKPQFAHLGQQGYDQYLANMQAIPISQPLPAPTAPTAQQTPTAPLIAGNPRHDPNAAGR